MAPISQIHAEEDEQGAEKEEDGDLLGEDDPGEEDGSDGVEVDVVGGDDRPELRHHPVPGEEAGHRGHTAEEKQVQKNRGIEDLKNGRSEDPGLIGEGDEIGNHREQPVDEHLAGDEERGVSLRGGYHQQRIEAPAEGSTEGQRVAQGREMEHEMAIEHDDGHAQGCHQRAYRLRAVQALRLVEDGDMSGGQEGRETDDERGVGCGGIVHRRVLREEIERASRDPEGQHHQLVAPGSREPAEGVSALPQRVGEQEDVGDDEAKCENLGRRQTTEQQQLGEDERASPNCHYRKGYQMI